MRDQTSSKPKTSDRKDAHLDLAMSSLAQAGVTNSMDRLRLTHCAMPECDLDAIDTSTQFLGYDLSSPLFIGAMTGGTKRADRINATLAETAQSCSVALAVGSQRAGLENGLSLGHLRKLAPDIPIIGNLGATQLAGDGGLDLAKAAIDDLQADALAIHLNPLQEAVQPEGDRDWHGVSLAIEQAVKDLSVPIIIKEVGAGINASLATRLFDMGVMAVDVAGLGGTNWARIEAARIADDEATLFAPFLDWGLPTLECLIDVCNHCPNHQVIASGGIRHGLDVAKALWVGASMVSMAGPMLKMLIDMTSDETVTETLSPETLSKALTGWQKQLALALFLTGSVDIASLRQADAELT